MGVRGGALDGFRYLAGNTVVLMSFVVDLIAMILGMPRALFPQMAHESFGGPVEGGATMALLAAAMSVGAVAGGVFSGWLPRVRRQGLAVVVAIVVWGAAMVGFGLAGGLAHRSLVDCRSAPVSVPAKSCLLIGIRLRANVGSHSLGEQTKLECRSAIPNG